MQKPRYVYMLFESPIREPYYFKVGYSRDPLKRLDQLQAGNPRHLRCWEFDRRPTKPFGFEFETEDHARRFEQRVHARLEGMGLRMRRDLNYETLEACEREWLADLHPEKVWLLMAEMYCEFVDEHAVQLRTLER
jgi:hypothetical protein